MNAARSLIDDLAKIGATVEPAGDRLILRAGPTAIPAALVNRLREAKADLIATLVHGSSAGEAQEHAAKSARHQFSAQNSRNPHCRMVIRASRSIRAGMLCMVCEARVAQCGGPAVRDRTGDTYMASRRMLARLARKPKGQGRRRTCGDGDHAIDWSHDGADSSRSTVNWISLGIELDEPKKFNRRKRTLRPR